MATFALPTICTIIAAAAFLMLERLAPGRELPHAPGWYARAILINVAQAAITFGTNRLWVSLFSGASLFDLAALPSPLLQGFIGWLVGTFFFYWWHRLRHVRGFWVIFHQVHHSPTRIEAMTAFYKHPIEILADSALAAMILYLLLGCSLEGALWFNFFAAAGELFYHSNIRTPQWINTLSRRQSCIRSTISSTCIGLILPICRCGIVCSERTAMLNNLPSNADSRAITSDI
jgi:sterol desaturase/sphingolipid hydroxylase (fatty acid hydroxylase superfamily)